MPSSTSGTYGSSTATGKSGPSATNGSTTGTTPDLNADAGKVVDEARNLAGTVAAEAQSQVGALAEQAKAQVGQAAEKVKGLAAEQKDYLAGQIGGVADAMDRVAADLEQNDAQSAGYARMIADNAEKLSGMVRDKDVDQLMAIAQDFGRRQPVVFVGAALLLGFAASRFLAASAERRQTETVSDYTTPETSTEDFMPASGYGTANGTNTGGGL